MGNQNATGIHEEDKAANQYDGYSSNNESRAAKETKDDQLSHPTADTKELSAAPALSDHDPPEDASNHHLDNQTLDIKDDVKDAILNSTGAVLREPDALVHADAEVDDHVLEKINQDPFFRESKVTSCSIDEISINGAEGEIGLTAEKMLEAEDHIKEVINAEEECETNGKNHPEMSSIEQVNEGDKSSNAFHHQEIFHPTAISDALIDHLNTKDETFL